MPIIKSAIKKMKQDIKKTKRNNVYRNRLTTRMKELMQAAHDKELEKLPELLKKNLLSN